MISICIPCYNEEEIIERTYSRIKKELENIKQEYEIIFCNDGSIDKTLEKLKRIEKQDNSVKIISYFSNSGVGEAYKRMFNKAKGKYIVIIDADLAISAKNIIKFYNEMLSKKDSGVIIGSRYVGIKVDYPIYRKIVSRTYFFLYKLLFSLDIKDVESGFAVFKRKTIKNLNIQSKGFESLLEIYLKIQDKGYKIKEIPVYFRHRRDSKVRIIKHSMIALIGTIKLFIERKKHFGLDTQH